MKAPHLRYVPALVGGLPAVPIDRWARARAPAVRVGAATIHDLEPVLE